MQDLNEYTKEQLVEIATRCREKLGIQRFEWVLAGVDWQIADELDIQVRNLRTQVNLERALAEDLKPTPALMAVKMKHIAALETEADKLAAKADRMRKRG